MSFLRVWFVLLFGAAVANVVTVGTAGDVTERPNPNGLTLGAVL